ncbi:MAG TPA: glycosyltransferase family 4 protein [Clostridiales bacterium]|nr:glycosyltransferase family 4 protein [Clostridiales bacterium]
MSKDKFKPVPDIEMKIRLRSLLGIPQDHIVFLSVGSLIKRKDPLSIIKAFKDANYKNRATLILLGDGELMEQCEKESNENIILKGNVRNVTDYLQASDVYISASKSEGLLNSVLEAGSCGLDLILSDIPQHKEIFEGNLGLANFFEVGDIGALSTKINKAINKMSRDINYDLATYVENNFTNKVMSRNYEYIYYFILKDKTKNEMLR